MKKFIFLISLMPIFCNGMQNNQVSDLITASVYGDLKRVRLFLAKGANVNAQTPHLRKTALHVASAKGHLEIVKLLLSHGADINAKDQYWHTAMHLASMNGHLKIVRFLQTQGAEISTSDKA